MARPPTRRRPTRGGVRPAKRICFYCRGAGRINDDYDFEEGCPICGGTGMID